MVGYQGADNDAEQLALTEQLFDAASGELGVVALDQPCLIVGDFNVEPTKIPCLAKGILAGLWVDLEGVWVLAAGVLPTPTCKMDWASTGGHRRDFMVGFDLAAAAVLSATFNLVVGLLLILLSGLFFDCIRWTCRVTQPVQHTPLWPASCMPALDKGRGSKSVEVQSVWGIHDERLQFLSRQDALHLDESLDAGDVFRAWLVWSEAPEPALVDAGFVLVLFLAGFGFGAWLCFVQGRQAWWT